jgi:hypothetical protein
MKQYPKQHHDAISRPEKNQQHLQNGASSFWEKENTTMIYQNSNCFSNEKA